MESVLTNACTIKIENFEGPFDLLFHLFEKNKINIYDIPINIVVDQYMEFLFSVQELDLDVASEFIVFAATLLHIKSKMLLPVKREKDEEAQDPREELVEKLIEYKKYKEVASHLTDLHEKWSTAYYKSQEEIEFEYDVRELNLCPKQLTHVYKSLVCKNENKTNKHVRSATDMILQYEKVSMKSKMRQVIKALFNSKFFRFSELFCIKTKSKVEVVTGFMAILELSKQRRLMIEQEKPFSEIIVRKREEKF